MRIAVENGYCKNIHTAWLNDPLPPEPAFPKKLTVGAVLN
jgi:hypothetical protein